jgi:FKBP-type peptidyl-prolyl cis-trans isomerase FklB
LSWAKININFGEKSIMGIADRLFNQKNEKAAANLKAGQDFLEENKKKPGVVALPSGLQYEILVEGKGARPVATNQVTCHYHGTLIDGTVFDSSVRRGQPATFPLNGVIKGWTEGVQLMPAGSKWRFYIPPNLAYGDRQVSAQIGPNSTLIFDVELISFN